jgi:hypothetical protein
MDLWHKRNRKKEEKTKQKGQRQEENNKAIQGQEKCNQKT